MQITVNKKDYTLYFGFKFLRQINKWFGTRMEVDGQEINMRVGGLPFMTAALSQYDPPSVVDVLKAALATESSKPSNALLEEYVNSLLIEDEKKYKTFVDELSEEIKKEPMLKALSKLNLN